MKIINEKQKEELIEEPKSDKKETTEKENLITKEIKLNIKKKDKTQKK